MEPILLAILVAGVCLAGIDANIVNAALPAIGAALHAGARTSWAISAFMLALAVGTPLFGKLSDIHGRRPMLLAAVGIFVSASLVCGLARDIATLAVGRAMQGIGVSGISTLASITVADHVPLLERNRYQAVFMTAYAISSLIGPFVGGFLTQFVGWRWIFLVNPPLGMIIFVAILRFWPVRQRAERARLSLDLPGAGLMATTAVLAMAAIGLLGERENAGMAGILASAALLTLVVLIRVERRAPAPFLSLEMIGMHPFPTIIGISALIAFPFFGSICFFPLYLQLGRGISPMLSGLALAPQIVGLIASSWLASWIVRHDGTFFRCILIGVTLVATGLVLIGLAALYDVEIWLLEAAVLILGLGGGMVRPNLIAVAQQSVRSGDLGIGTATLTFLHTLSGAAGVSIGGALLYGRIASLSAGSSGPAVLAAAAAHRPEAMNAYSQAIALIFLGGGALALGSVALAIWLMRVGAGGVRSVLDMNSGSGAS